MLLIIRILTWRFIVIFGDEVVCLNFWNRFWNVVCDRYWHYMVFIALSCLYNVLQFVKFEFSGNEFFRNFAVNISSISFPAVLWIPGTSLSSSCCVSENRWVNTDSWGWCVIVWYTDKYSRICWSRGIPRFSFKVLIHCS